MSDLATLKAGSRWRSTVDTTEVIVVRAPAQDVSLQCGGAPMVDPAAEVAAGTIDPAHAEGNQLGKRYVDDEVGLEVLCTKAGQGSLAVDGRRLGLKEAKPLPSSD
jgi:hypothetical protein